MSSISFFILTWKKTFYFQNAAYMILRGMKTLHLRVQQHNSTALRMAQFLEEHPKVLHFPLVFDYYDYCFMKIADHWCWNFWLNFTQNMVIYPLTTKVWYLLCNAQKYTGFYCNSLFWRLSKYPNGLLKACIVVIVLSWCNWIEEEFNLPAIWSIESNAHVVELVPNYWPMPIFDIKGA